MNGSGWGDVEEKKMGREQGEPVGREKKGNGKVVEKDKYFILIHT